MDDTNAFIQTLTGHADHWPFVYAGDVSRFTHEHLLNRDALVLVSIIEMLLCSVVGRCQAKEPINS